MARAKKARKVQRKGRQGKPPAALGEREPAPAPGRAASARRPAASAPRLPTSSAPADEERDALGRRQRLESRSVDEAERRRKALDVFPRLGIVRSLQQLVARDCERWHLSARGAAKACGMAHPTARGILEGNAKGYCYSLDKLIEGIGEDELVLAERVVLMIKAARKRGR